jgi:hypothetical protein
VDAAASLIEKGHSARKRAMATTALDEFVSNAGPMRGHFGSSLEPRIEKRAVDVGFQVVHPTGQYSKKYPLVDGHVLRLSRRHAKLRREGYRKR